MTGKLYGRLCYAFLVVLVVGNYAFLTLTAYTSTTVQSRPQVTIVH